MGGVFVSHMCPPCFRFRNLTLFNHIRDSGWGLSYLQGNRTMLRTLTVLIVFGTFARSKGVSENATGDTGGGGTTVIPQDILDALDTMIRDLTSEPEDFVFSTKEGEDGIIRLVGNDKKPPAPLSSLIDDPRRLYETHRELIQRFQSYVKTLFQLN